MKRIRPTSRSPRYSKPTMRFLFSRWDVLAHMNDRIYRQVGRVFPGRVRRILLFSLRWDWNGEETKIVSQRKIRGER